MIEPTVGRIVWFYAAKAMLWGDDELQAGPEHPRAAMVAHVYDGRTVNLMVTDRFGCPRPVQMVQLLQDDDRPAAPGGYWCAWMPYQKGQAAKVEALQAQGGTTSEQPASFPDRYHGDGPTPDVPESHSD